MLTAVDPGLDVLDMPFDDYRCKPVEKENLVEAIDQQLNVIRHNETLSEYFELTSKLALLESDLPEDADGNGDIAELHAQVAELRAELDEAMDGLDDIEAAFANIERNPSDTAGRELFETRFRARGLDGCNQTSTVSTAQKSHDRQYDMAAKDVADALGSPARRNAVDSE